MPISRDRVRPITAMAVAALLLLCSAGTALPQADAPQSEPTLRPGDVITLRIWREPDLSGEFQVNEDGEVVFPRIGPMEVTGRSPAEVKAELLEEFSETLRNPSIEITLLRRITVAGEVREPGVYTVDPTMSLVEAMALAGGYTQNADRDEITLVRGGEERTIDLTGSVNLQSVDVRSGDQLIVPQRSWFLRNWAIVGTLISAALTLTVLLTR